MTVEPVVGAFPTLWRVPPFRDWPATTFALDSIWARKEGLGVV